VPDETADASSGPGRLDRRDFLGQLGAAATAVVIGGLGVPGLLKGPAFPSVAEATGVIFPEPSLCIGCLTCEVVCSDIHRDAGLSEMPRIRIYDLDTVEVRPEIIRNYGDRGQFFPEPCLQCPDPPCLAVCPVDAFYVEDGTGARVIDADRCIACGKCEQACAFAALDEQLATNDGRFGQRSRITYDPQLNAYTKCDLCYFREEGPVCVERCPVNVRIRQGLLESDVLCLDLPSTDPPIFAALQRQQTERAPATANARS
jgi:Fe-S-cluster-containing hydrogenase component 2